MNQNFQIVVSQQILSALKERNVSQTELAQMIQKSRAYVSNIIKGRYLPKIHEMMKIANYLKKPISFFMGEDCSGLNNYTDKAKKWDSMVALLDKEFRNDFRKDIISIPVLDHSQLRNSSYKELQELKENALEYIYISKDYIKNTFHYLKPLEEIVAVKIFIRSYPEFGIELGDIGLYEPVVDNDIGDNEGKLFAVFYKGDVAIKRIYREGKYYYFEPFHTQPVIENLKQDDPNLLIPGRIVLVIHAKMF